MIGVRGCSNVTISSPTWAIPAGYSREKLGGLKMIKKIIIVTIVIASILVGCGSNASFDATINGTGISFESSAKKAANKATMELVGSENLLLIDLTETDAKSVEIKLSGKNSTKTFDASSNDIVKDVFNGIKGFIGSNGIVHAEGTSFYINANAFEEGEVVVMEVTFVKSESALDKAFDKGEETEYWAFIAKHSEDAPETSEDAESTDEPAKNDDTDTDANTDESENTNNDEKGIIDRILDGIQSWTGDSSKDESNVPEASKEPVGAFTIGGCKLKTYATQELSHADIQGLPAKLADSPEMVGYPLENTARIKVWFEGESDTRELLLWSENNWTGQFSMSAYSGQTVTLCIAYESSGIIPDFTFEYVTVQVP